MKLKLEILPDKEFFKKAQSDPRYQHVDEGNLGFSDPQKGVAYVRFSHWPDLMRETAIHELDHLFEQDGTDEDEFGIRHRKKGGFAGFLNKNKGFLQKGAAIAAAPFTGGLSLAAVPFTASTGSRRWDMGLGLGSAALGLGGVPGTSFKGLLGGGGQSGFTNLLKSPMGAFKQGGQNIMGGFQKLGGGLSSVEGRIGDTLQFSAPGGGMLGQTGQFGGATESARSIVGGAGGGGILGKLGGGIGKMFGGGGGGGLGSLGSLGNLGMAGGLLGIGQFGKQSPEVPDLSNLPSVRRLQSEVDNPSSPLTQAARGSLMNRFNTPFSGADPLEMQGINDSYNNLVKQYSSQYKLSRPNADLATDTQFRLGMEEIERRRAQDLAGKQTEARNRYDTLQTDAISQSLGIDRETLQNLTNLAQLDIEEISAQLGIDERDAASFKEQFGSLASLFATKALFPNAYQVPSYNVLGGGR